MEDLQREHAPLFGRVDLRLHVRPFSYLDAAAFHPSLSAEERAIAYGVLGGMPTYQLRWDGRLGHRANLRRLFGDPSSPPLDEGEVVLASELPEGAGYFRILRAIAAGERTDGGIKRLAAMDIERQLDRLTPLGLMERVTPVTEPAPRHPTRAARRADRGRALVGRGRCRRDRPRGPSRAHGGARRVGEVGAAGRAARARPAPAGRGGAPSEGRRPRPRPGRPGGRGAGGAGGGARLHRPGPLRGDGDGAAAASPGGARPPNPRPGRPPRTARARR